MRLLCGAIRFDGQPFSPDLLHRMVASLIAPGLKPRKHQYQSATALLATLSFHPEGDAEPVALAVRDSGGVLASDVRLDESSQTGRSLQLAEYEGERCVAGVLDSRGLSGLPTLSGDFAVADWSTRSRTLLLARDGMGVRPLVYSYRRGKFVVFASFARALHASGLVERRLDQDCLVREMLGGARMADSLFQEIRSVEPGCALQFRAASKERSVFWRPRARLPLLRSAAEAAEALRVAVESAVESRIAGSGPIAAHLSGGLDSSALCVLAARQMNAERRPLLAYSLLNMVDEDADDGDQPYIASVLAQEPSIDWLPVSQTGSIGRNRLKRDRVLSDDPGSPENRVCEDAWRRGASLILSGWGGDEAATFNGRGALVKALLTLRLPYFVQEFKALRRHRGFSPSQILRGEILAYLLPKQVRSLARRVRGHAKEPGGIASFLRPAALQSAFDKRAQLTSIGGRVGHNQLSLIRGVHLSHRMSAWAEIGADHGVAFAFPLLDRRVVECALSIPGHFFLRGGWKRRPFRDAMEGVLPEIIRWRHDKLAPYPDSTHRLAAQAKQIAARMRTLLSRSAVDALLDTGQVERTLDSLSTPLQLGANPGRVENLLRVVALLNYAEFLERENSQSSTKLLSIADSSSFRRQIRA